MLRVKNGVPLQHLRKVAQTLSHLKDDLWAKTTLYVADRKVVFEDPETGKPREVVSGQYVMKYPLKVLLAETQSDIDRIRSRGRDQVGKVAHFRGIARNAAVVAGTRISVASIKRLQEDGFSVPQIIAEYPDLTKADVKAALASEAAAA